MIWLEGCVGLQCCWYAALLVCSTVYLSVYIYQDALLLLFSALCMQHRPCPLPEPIWLVWLFLHMRYVQSSNAWLPHPLRHPVTLSSTLWHVCYLCKSSLSLVFLFLAEAILSGDNEGSLSSESDESDDDEHELSKGTFVVLCFKMVNLGLCELHCPQYMSTASPHVNST